VSWELAVLLHPAYTHFIPDALAPISNLRTTTMTSITNKQAVPATPAEPFTLIGLIETLFSIKLREQLDADTKGDKSDAAYHWGM